MKSNRDLIITLTTIVMFISGYVFLRYAFQVSDQLPFTQEVVLIFLGTLATVLITALLLRKQSEVELEKEKAVKYLELKFNVYLEIIKELEELLLNRTFDDEQLMQLEFLAHKVAIVASPEFLKAYGHFLQDIKQYIQDECITDTESDLISRRKADLTVEMRRDLIGELDRESEISEQFIQKAIIHNIEQSVEAFK